MASVAACGDAGDTDMDGLPEAVVAWEGATVFTTPDAPPVEDAVLVVVDGVVEAVGPRGSVQIPQAARRRNALGLSVVPGLWNADVRLDDELSEIIRDGEDIDLALALEDRFTRYGITTVVFTEADPEELAELRRRVAEEGLPSPRLLGPDDMPSSVRRAHGPDLGLWESEDPDDLLLGLALDEAALVPGLSRMARWREGEFAEEVDARVEAALAALLRYVDAGGVVVLGTGAGWIQDWDPSSELLMMEDAGLTFEEILSAATFQPSLRMPRGSDGEIEPGAGADLLFVEGDPSSDLSSLSRVREVLVGGFSVHEAGG
ncbi:MAG: hypothetical protein EA352_05465 [Gemmatimonadales bacterium]|nr:MAG: hypothetical protein EA352_05465 [Gemmatimonadales bacterium]